MLAAFRDSDVSTGSFKIWLLHSVNAAAHSVNVITLESFNETSRWNERLLVELEIFVSLYERTRFETTVGELFVYLF